MNLTDYIPKFMDRYDRAARLTPALLVAMPAVVLIQNIAGVSNSFPKIAISILFYCGLAYVLSRAARNAGQRIQDRIFVKWGGAPWTPSDGSSLHRAVGRVTRNPRYFGRSSFLKMTAQELEEI